MPITAKGSPGLSTLLLHPAQLKLNQFSLSIYGDPSTEIDNLLPSIRDHGILVALVVAPGPEKDTWEVISGHRRLACAQILGFTEVPCEVRYLAQGEERQHLVLEYNRQRRKTFSQLMREADAIEKLWKADAKSRRLGNLRQGRVPDIAYFASSDRRNSDDRAVLQNSNQGTHGNRLRETGGCGRTDQAIAQAIEIGGKDLYRQARKIWQMAQSGDVRAQDNLRQLDAGTKTIHASYKDLRRRDRFSADFQPTPYDVWRFRHDRAFGIPHPGVIPPGIVAHALYYFTHPSGLVVDPMAGGGTTPDVCQSMGRRCLAYDLHPARPDIQAHDIRKGFPPEAHGCDLIFCDPPYHTMLAGKYASDAVASVPLSDWIAFLHQLAHHAIKALRPGGYMALLVAAQTEKDLPAGFGYLDHAFYGYLAALRAGFLPERRISCPMDGYYLPQHVRQARREGRLLGQVRDLLIVRKPLQVREPNLNLILSMQDFPIVDQQ